MFLKYSTSNILLRIEMLTMTKEIKLFVVFCILAGFPYSFLASLCFFATLFSFYYHDMVLTPMKNRLYNMN